MDKGKEKEKRSTGAESDSDPEFEEALRKTKEDEERRAELHHKRGEDVLRFNDVSGIKEKFFEGIQNTNFNEEKKFSLNGIEKDFPNILHQIEEIYWQIFTLPPGRYYPQLVKVKGIKVECSAKAINKTYFDDDDVDATDYLAKLENLDNHYTWIASLIEVGFVYSRLTPSKNDNEVPISRAILISSIMKGVHINVGDIIAMEMRDRARQAYTSLPFSVLVTNLCCDACVPEIARIDENIRAK
ncbi:hypothetical protein HAX54_045751 [Datura stramonium]|uniref:Putative plant transposon protein domain-containing protein n=1 Tax=Datura stramonium TaxID=4076 RepID=A0ABS8SQT1_DATST|nr:hypothetical protein [Datura stramonium]